MDAYPTPPGWEAIEANRWSAGERLDTLIELGDRTREAVRTWLDGAKRVVHIGYAKHTNTGDHLILRAEQLLFESLGVEYIPLEMSTFRLPDDLRRLPLVFKGGGYLGDPGAWHYRKMCRWILAQRAPVLMMPCSVRFDSVSPDLWKRAVRFSDLTIFNRDRRSFGIIDDIVPGLPKLVPDSAYFSSRALKHRRGDRKVLLPRSDREAAPVDLSGRYPGIEVREWLQKKVKPSNVLDVIADKFDDVGWLATDRLHVHVAAKILALPHDFLPNSYHKNTAFYATWSTEDPLVRWVDS
jgi:exopolysaccharide biosynthesis predicted pyruvyltransferase EpsI